MNGVESVHEFVEGRSGLPGWVRGLDGLYPVRVTAVWVGWEAPTGSVCFTFLLAELFTVLIAFFTHSTCGSAQTLRPRLVINLQRKEKTTSVTSSQPWDRELRSDQM